MVPKKGGGVIYDHHIKCIAYRKRASTCVYFCDLAIKANSLSRIQGFCNNIPFIIINNL